MPEKEKQDKKQQRENPPQSKLNRLLPIIILILVTGVSSVAGLGVGRIFADRSGIDSGSQADSGSSDRSGTDERQIWYHDLEPIVANLDEPGAMRYIRATLTLGISTELNKEEGQNLIEKNKPVLNDWLSIYLASLSVTDVQGDRNQRVIQSQIRDAFNQELFGDGQPKIERVLFKEFAIQ